MTVHIINAIQLNQKQKEEIITLWNAEYPINFMYADLNDFEKYLNGLQDQKHLLVVNDQNVVLGWFMHFVRDNDRWFTIVLDTSIKGKSIGTKLLDNAKAKNEALNGWVTDHDNFLKNDGKNYKSPISFYEKNGFKIHPEITLKSEKISLVKIRWQKEM